MTRTWWALLGLVGAALGAALLIERNGGAGEMAELARRWWPVLLVGLGLVNLIRLSNARWAVMGPLLAIIAGALLLLPILDVPALQQPVEVGRDLRAVLGAVSGLTPPPTRAVIDADTGVPGDGRRDPPETRRHPAGARFEHDGGRL
jgi:hypothetical protein